MPPGSRSGSRQERGGRAGDCRRMETAAAALPQMRAFAGRLRVAARMRDAGGRTRQNVRRGSVDDYTTNIISSRDL
jgi:hypothetical protein